MKAIPNLLNHKRIVSILAALLLLMGITACSNQSTPKVQTETPESSDVYGTSGASETSGATGAPGASETSGASGAPGASETSGASEASGEQKLRTADVSTGTEPAQETEGFDSPESAVESYIDGLRANDLDRMLKSFAVETYVDYYSLQARLERTHGYIFMEQEINLPTVNDFARDINIEGRKSSIVNDILRQYVILCKLDLDTLNNPVSLKEEKESKEFVAQLSEQLQATKFSTVQILGYIPPEALSDTYGTDRNQKNLAELAECYGAEKIVSRVPVIELGEDKYVLCFDAIEYDGKWFVHELGGNISVLTGIASYLVGTIPLDAEDEALLESMMVPIGS